MLLRLWLAAVATLTAIATTGAGVAFASDTPSMPTSSDVSSGTAVDPMQGGAGCLDLTSISNVASAGTVTKSPTGPNWQVSGLGPATLTLSHTNSVSNAYSVGAGVNLSVVSSNVGFSITGTSTVTTSYAYAIPAGQTWMVQADTVFDKKTFHWSRTHGCTGGIVTDTGTGYALKFARLSYRAYRI